MLVNSVARHFIEKCRSLAPQNSPVRLCKNCRNNEDAFREAGSPRCGGCGKHPWRSPSVFLSVVSRHTNGTGWVSSDIMMGINHNDNKFAKTNRNQTAPISSFQNGLANIENVWQYVTFQCAKRFWYSELSSCDVNQVMDRMLLLLTSRGKKNSSKKWGAKSPTRTQETHTHTPEHAIENASTASLRRPFTFLFHRMHTAHDGCDGQCCRANQRPRPFGWFMMIHDDSSQSPWRRIPYLGKGLGKNHQEPMGTQNHKRSILPERPSSW